MRKNRITYIFALVALVALVFIHEATMTYIALYTVLILPIFSLFLTLLSRRRFLIKERLMQESILKGEVTQYVISVQNRSFMPAASLLVRFKVDSPAVVIDLTEQVMAIAPFRSKKASFNVEAKYRGHYKIGVSEIVLYDFLGLFKFKQKHDKSLNLTVRPLTVTINPLPIAAAQTGDDEHRVFSYEEDYAVISDLRKYIPTDGYKKIHWKISAKKNELISKNFQSTKRNTVVFLIENSSKLAQGYYANPQEYAAKLEDEMMQGLVSAMAQVAGKGNLCALYHINSAGGEYSTDGEWLYDQACEIRFEEYDQSDFASFLAVFTKMQADAENVVMIVKKITPHIADIAQELKIFGNNVIIMYYESDKWETDETVHALQDRGIHCLGGVGLDYGS